MVPPTESTSASRDHSERDSQTELVTQPFARLWNLEAIFHLPIKVARPPTLKTEVTGERTETSEGLWRRLNFRRDLEVSLDDMLDSRCLPPLGLKDFESYLCFTEFCAQNLYFILWFRAYQAAYIEWDMSSTSKEQANTDQTPSAPLIRSFNIAVDIFFSASAFQVAIPEDLRRSVLRLLLAPNPNHPVLVQVNTDVRNLLNMSLKRFLAQSHWNMGRAYIFLGYILGAFLVIISLIPLVATLELEYPIRLSRLVGIIPLFIGLYILDTSRYGVCPIIYGLSDMRQIRPWEQKTSIPSSRAGSLDMARTISITSTASRPYLVEDGAPHPSSERIHAGFIPSFNPDASSQPRSERPCSSPTPTLSGPSSRSFDFSSLPNVIFRKSSLKAGYSQATKPESDGHEHEHNLPESEFDHDHELTIQSHHDLESQSPPRITTASFPPVPCFARLTMVHSPIIRRLQWEIVIKSMALQMVLAGGITAGLMMVHIASA